MFPIVLEVIQAAMAVIIPVIAAIVPVILNITQVVIPIILEVVQAVFPAIMEIIQMVIPIVIEKSYPVWLRLSKCGGARHSNHFADCGQVPCRDGDTNVIGIITNIIKFYLHP
ncbi:hypothetical protein P7H20_16630 [Paenibacillus larvae]|nr:hypothetical protein [Paenibacillus larvae]MDT2276129.1 hypothetical protein [Paenibacillus larvae]